MPSLPTCRSRMVFSSLGKAARVTPLLKKPNLSPHEPANYRPIVVSVLYIFQNTRKTGFVQVATARHEVGKLLQVSVNLSERTLHRDSSSESSQRHSEGRREQALDISSAGASTPYKRWSKCTMKK